MGKHCVYAPPVHAPGSPTANNNATSHAQTVDLAAAKLNDLSDDGGNVLLLDIPKRSLRSCKDYVHDNSRSSTAVNNGITSNGDDGDPSVRSARASHRSGPKCLIERRKWQPAEWRQQELVWFTKPAPAGFGSVRAPASSSSDWTHLGNKTARIVTQLPLPNEMDDDMNILVMENLGAMDMAKPFRSTCCRAALDLRGGPGRSGGSKGGNGGPKDEEDSDPQVSWSNDVAGWLGAFRLHKSNRTLRARRGRKWW